MGVIEEAAALIDQRVTELRQELGKLEEARTLLGRIDQPAKRKPRAARTKAKAKAKSRRGRVDRGAQLKGIVTADPTIRPIDLAKQMGISNAQVHGVIKRLRERGELTKSDAGYEVKPALALAS